jgi:ribonuclease HI
MIQDEKITIYTDGSCLGNPGKGGWGAVMIYNNHQKNFSGSQEETTNNRMEIKAVIEALKNIKKPKEIQIYTDSKYVQNGITSWIFNWKKNGWKSSNRKPVKNIDLWQELDNLVQKYQISWHWVKGHDGDKYNEIADQLARKAAEKIS